MSQQPAARTDRELTTEVANHRTPGEDVDPLFVNRWSPRAMTGEPLEESAYMPLFEAARWAPSAFNNQHWRFVYATREDDEFEQFLDLLNDANRAWASDAGVLAVIVSKTTFDHNDEPAPVHSFDTGAAWENLALEGARRDLAVHGMAGFDYERAHDELDVPDDFAVEAMFAVGERAPAETLPEELQDGEFPSDRKDLDEIVRHGSFE
jgi:nitroreductase